MEKHLCLVVLCFDLERVGVFVVSVVFVLSPVPSEMDGRSATNEAQARAISSALLFFFFWCEGQEMQ